MFRYFYRIFDRHGKRIVSLAVLTGTESIPSEGQYDLITYGSGVHFQYLPFRLRDYDKAQLEHEVNPIALVILAAQERERLRRKGERLPAKLALIRQLYERGYTREQIIGLFTFIDWVVQLAPEEDLLFWDGVKALEEDKHMPYITTGERIGREQGRQEGRQEGLLEASREMVLRALAEKFGEIPPSIAERLNQITEPNQLYTLLPHVLRNASLAEFTQFLPALKTE